MKNCGFTLIELSMVLVIIGLISGGILVGRELFHAAEIRATIRQVEDFNAAVNTFKGKYNCLPGDCANAGNFFDPATDGDGNGLIGCPAEDTSLCGGPPFPDTTEIAEYVNFWYHLSSAGLISYSVKPYDSSFATQFAGLPYSPPAKIKPRDQSFAPAGATFGWVVRGNIKYLEILPAHNFTLSYYVPSPSVEYGYYPVFDVYSIDRKLDDGLPYTGSVVAWTFGIDSPGLPDIITYQVNADPGGADTTPCINNSVTPNAYNTASTRPMCAPMIRASF